MKYTQKMLLVLLLVGSSLQGSELLKLASSCFTNCWVALQNERVAIKEYLATEERVSELVEKLQLHRVTYPDNIDFSKDLVPGWCAERLTSEERAFLKRETYLKFPSNPPRVLFPRSTRIERLRMEETGYKPSVIVAVNDPGDTKKNS